MRKLIKFIHTHSAMVSSWVMRSWKTYQTLDSHETRTNPNFTLHKTGKQMFHFIEWILLRENGLGKKRQQRDLVLLALYISDLLTQAKESSCEWRQNRHNSSSHTKKDNSAHVLWGETQGLSCSCTTAVTSVLALSHYRDNFSSYYFVWTLPTTIGFHHWTTRLVLHEETVQSKSEFS